MPDDVIDIPWQQGPATRHGRTHGAQQAGGAIAGVSMQVLNSVFGMVQVERVICMVVVTGGLHMHHQVVHRAGTLCHRRRAEHGQGLPQKDC